MGRPFLMLAACGFLIMASHGVARPVSNALFLQYFGSSDMLWGMALVPVLATLLLLPYSWALTRFGPGITCAGSTLLSAFVLSLPWFFPGAVPVFLLYVWKEVYVVLLVEQFWALANSTFSLRGSKNAYGPILLIGGLGAVAGSELVARFSTRLGTWAIYPLSPLLLIPFGVLMVIAHRSRVARAASKGAETHAGHGPAQGLDTLPARADGSGGAGDAGSRREPRSSESRKEGGLGFGLLASSGFLTSIAVVVGLGQVMVAALDVVFHRELELAIVGLDARSAYEGRFWGWVNGGSMVLQLAAPFLLRLFSVPLLHLLIPLTHVVAVGAMMLFGGLFAAAAAFSWLKIVDYSVFRSCKEVLYVPLDFDSRYRAKMAIDMVIYRATKGGAALLLSVLGGLTAAATRLLPVTALGAAAAWVFFALKIGRGFATLEADTQVVSKGDSPGD
ncbi:MAG: hypothetical protein FJ109_04120 [Deltaproteobacteria bacterium]|nr:hypothetical protein [Deltaproteobacteria bacterium]